MQSFVWDFTRDGPVKWDGAGKFFKGPDEGAGVPPGRYTIAMTLSGKTFTVSANVKPDPDTLETPAEIEAAAAFNNAYMQKFSELDVTLNRLDDIKAQLTKTRAVADTKKDVATVAAIDKALADRQTLQDALTADYQNFEDFVQRSGRLREDLSNAGTGLVTPAVLDYGRRVDANYAARTRDVDAFLKSLAPLSATLKAAGYPEVK